MILYEFPILCYWYVYKRNVAVMLIEGTILFRHGRAKKRRRVDDKVCIPRIKRKKSI